MKKHCKQLQEKEMQSRPSASLNENVVTTLYNPEANYATIPGDKSMIYSNGSYQALGFAASGTMGDMSEHFGTFWKN